MHKELFNSVMTYAAFMTREQVTHTAEQVYLNHMKAGNFYLGTDVAELVTYFPPYFDLPPTE